MKHLKKLILMTQFAILLLSIAYSQDSTNESTISNEIDTCINKQAFLKKIHIALDCFEMYDGTTKKITELNGEIDTLNIVVDFYIEKTNIFQVKLKESQTQIKKHKSQKIWIPIVSSVVAGGVFYGVGRATK